MADTEPTARPTADAVAPLAQSRNPTGKKTADEVELALLAAIEEGQTVRQAASHLGLHIRTAYEVLGRSEESLDALRAATRRLMARGALDRLRDWEVASDVGARKKGNHAPARDWLLHAGVIDQLQGDSGKVSIAINIGTDDKPMKIASPLTIDVEQGDH